MIVKLDEITITKVIVKGSNRIAWNVDKNGIPFGQIWTFRNTDTETHLFHAKDKFDVYAAFKTYAEAETFMRGLM
jgi:hypothetical protein